MNKFTLLALAGALSFSANARTVVDTFTPTNLYSATQITLTGESGAEYQGCTNNSHTGVIKFTGAASPYTGLATTKSPGICKKITLTWANYTELNVTWNNKAYIAARHEAFTGIDQMFAEENSGILDARNVTSPETVWTPEEDDDFEAVGVRTAGGFIGFSKIEIEWEVEDAPAPAPEWCIPTGNAGFSGRYVSGLTVRVGDAEAVAITGCQTNVTTKPYYYDKTENVIVVKPGDAVNVAVQGAGEWMHNYLFVDYNNDGTFTPSLAQSNSVPNEGSELVSHTGYFYTGNKPFYNSKGVICSTANGSAGNTDYGKITDPLPEFTIPADLAPGDYRARYKMSWNSVDPCGVSDDTSNPASSKGGAVIDFTLRIEEEEEPTPTEFTVTMPAVKTEGRLYGAITAPSVGALNVGENTVAANGTIMLALQKYSGYENYTANITCNGEDFDFGTEQSKTVTVDKDMVFDVTFEAPAVVEPTKYTVTIEQPTGATITVRGFVDEDDYEGFDIVSGKQYPEGTILSAEYEEEEDYEFVTYIVNGENDEFGAWDLTGNMTITAEVRFTGVIPNKALTFDASTNSSTTTKRIEICDKVLFADRGVNDNNQTSWTLGLWFKPTSFHGSYKNVLMSHRAQAHANVNGSTMLTLDSQGNLCTVAGAGNQQKNDFNAKAKLNEWNYATLSYNAETYDITVSLNGSIAGTYNNTKALAYFGDAENVPSICRYGTIFSIADNFFTGAIDEFQIFDQVLTADEILAAYTDDYDHIPYMVAQYTFDQVVPGTTSQYPNVAEGDKANREYNAEYMSERFQTTWGGDGVCITMTYRSESENEVVDGRGEIAKHHVAVKAEPATLGTVVIDGYMTTETDLVGPATMTATVGATEGAYFVKWTNDADNSVVSTEPTYTYTGDEDASFTAHFNIHYKVTVEDEVGTTRINGPIDSEGYVDKGETVTVNCYAEGKVLTSLMINGTDVVEYYDNGYTFTVNETTVIRPTYETVKWTLSVAVEGEGTVTVSAEENEGAPAGETFANEAKLEDGTEFYIFAIPAEKMMVKSFMIDGDELVGTEDLLAGAGKSFYFQYGAYDDVTVSVTFEVDPTNALNAIGVDAAGDARFFNLQGMEVARDNLVPGVYVMHSAGVATKVMVK